MIVTIWTDSINQDNRRAGGQPVTKEYAIISGITSK